MSRKRIAAEIRERVFALAEGRCSYCLSRQEYVWGKLEIEHVVPLLLGGSDDEANLCLACRPCNLYKSAQVATLDPLSASACRCSIRARKAGETILHGVQTALKSSD